MTARTEFHGQTLLPPIRRWARDDPERTAIMFEDRPVSYATLMRWVDRVAGDLRDLDVRTGDRVAIVGPNSLEACITVLATIAVGGIVAPLNFRWVARELRDVMVNCSPKVIVADEQCHHEVLVAIGDAAEPAFVPMSAVIERQQGATAPAVDVAHDPDEAAVIVYTSGSTAAPKGVTFTQRAILSGIFEWSIMEPGFRGPHRYLLTLPLGSSGGILRGLLYTLIPGGTLYLERTFNPDRTLELIQRERLTVMHTTPYVFERLVESPGFADADFSSLVSTTVSGAHVSTKLIEIWRRRGIILRQAWGLTEAGGSCTLNSPDLALSRPELCGRGGIWSRFRTVRDDGSPCEPDEPGEIVLSGPTLTMGYWNDAAATRKAFVDGWLHTGDVGRVDADGNLTFVGRQKDMIVSGGFNIAALEIEVVLGEMVGVEEVAVIGVPDDRFGEAVAAVIVVSDPIDPSAVRAHCDGKLARYKIPKRVVVTSDPLPRLPSGKVSKRDVRARYEAELVTHLL